MLTNKHKQQKSTIDTLIRYQAQLEVEKEKIRDKQNEENALIENQIQALENKASRNKQIADGKIADIDRLIKKGQEQMALEAKYYVSLTNDVKSKTDILSANASHQDTKRGV